MNVNDDPEIIWPPLPGATTNDPQFELKKLLYQAQLQTINARYEAVLEHDKALRASDYPLEEALFNAYLDVAKGQLDRARANAEFVVKAASTIGGAYALVLGLSFSINKDVNHPLPSRGLAPTIFLGLSIVLATAYLAYITRPKPFRGPVSSPPPLLLNVCLRNATPLSGGLWRPF